MSARLVVADIAARYVAVEALRSTIARWQSRATACRRPSRCKRRGRGPRRPAVYRFVNIQLAVQAQVQLYYKVMLCEKACKAVTILGDLNCPGINWSDFTSPCDGTQDKIFDCFREYGMTLLVNSVAFNDHILDLVLTNETANVLRNLC